MKAMSLFFILFSMSTFANQDLKCLNDIKIQSHDVKIMNAVSQETRKLIYTSVQKTNDLLESTQLAGSLGHAPSADVLKQSEEANVNLINQIKFKIRQLNFHVQQRKNLVTIKNTLNRCLSAEFKNKCAATVNYLQSLIIVHENQFQNVTKLHPLFEQVNQSINNELKSLKEKNAPLSFTDYQELLMAIKLNTLEFRVANEWTAEALLNIDHALSANELEACLN